MNFLPDLTVLFTYTLASLVLFITLPLLLRSGLGFWESLGASCIATAIAYFGMVKILDVFGIQI